MNKKCGAIVPLLINACCALLMCACASAPLYYADGGDPVYKSAETSQLYWRKDLFSFIKHMEYLKVGLSKREVRHHAGNPDNIYSNSEWSYIAFEDGSPFIFWDKEKNLLSRAHPKRYFWAKNPLHDLKNTP